MLRLKKIKSVNPSKVDYSDFNKEEKSKEVPWWYHPPKDLEGMLYYLETRAFKITADDEEGRALRVLFETVDKSFGETEEQIKGDYPLAYFKPSYEQSLLLNAWIWGYDFIACFSANRIGKTVAIIVNGQLWIFPNNPDWEIFAANFLPKTKRSDPDVPNPDADARFYWDQYDRPVQVLCRPTLESLDLIKQTLKDNPHLVGDPNNSHLEEGNAEKFQQLQELIPQAYASCYPYPPIQESGTLWFGAPDNLYHKTIIMKLWKQWLPRHSIKRWSETEYSCKLATKETANPLSTEFDVIFKSYDSEDTKWSGQAVLGIMLTEGIPPAIFNEVRLRIKEHGFGSWDYTPYEARNVGAKTALAFKVFKGEEQLPLNAYIFTRLSARKAPPHILPESKRRDMLRMYDGKAEGDARLDGIFYSSSPLILSKLDRRFHCLSWSVEELFERFPNGQIYRGLDPGYDHPTVCCWALLTPGNYWFIYRYYVERLKSISERCADIVRLSNNKLVKKRWGKKPDEYILREYHPNPTSEAVLLTAADFHLFQTDENTKVSYHLNYTKAGLLVTESTHMRPKDRAVDLDNKLSPNEYYVHPQIGTAPGAKIFFLINGQGVDQAVGKMESLFWDRLAGGPHKGEAKDEVPVHGDDELDATCYVVCGPYVWTRYQPPRQNNWVDQEDLEMTVASLQLQ